MSLCAAKRLVEITYKIAEVKRAAVYRQVKQAFCEGTLPSASELDARTRPSAPDALPNACQALRFPVVRSNGHIRIGLQRQATPRRYRALNDRSWEKDPSAYDIAAYLA
jgi:hypothetical protein